MQLHTMCAVPRQISGICEWPKSTDAFARRIVWVGERLLIHSTCAKCGVFKVASHHDRSLETWEEHHRCYYTTAIDVSTTLTARRIRSDTPEHQRSVLSCRR